MPEQLCKQRENCSVLVGAFTLCFALAFGVTEAKGHALIHCSDKPGDIIGVSLFGLALELCFHSVTQLHTVLACFLGLAKGDAPGLQCFGLLVDCFECIHAIVNSG